MIQADQPTIFDPAKVRAYVSSREDGNMRPEWSTPTDALQAVSAFAAQISIATETISVMDVGAYKEVWDAIADVTSRRGKGLDDPTERIAADALVTNIAGAALLLSVGDCNAVAIHDPAKNVLALVHLGWQSTVAELATKVVQHMQSRYYSSAADLRIYFSPAIKAESYIFDHVRQQDDPAWRPFLRRNDQGVGVDLPGYNRQRFIAAGVLAEHIEVSPVDTGTSDKYFSHYRAVRTGEPEGRFSLLVSLVA